MGCCNGHLKFRFDDSFTKLVRSILVSDKIGVVVYLLLIAFLFVAFSKNTQES